MKFFALLALAFAAAPAHADQVWPQRDAVVQAVDVLQQEIEIFDEALHNVNAPADLIEIVHHIEETAAELAEISRFAPRGEVAAEAAHLDADFELVRQKFNQYLFLRLDRNTRTAWQRTRAAYWQVTSLL